MTEQPIRDRLYEIWRGAVRRCHDPTRKDYPKYGGRGIRVCQEWRCPDDAHEWTFKGYLAFETWALAHGYDEHLTLDRANCNGPYSPGNCRWISKKAQAHNRSSDAALTFQGKTMQRVEWSR